MTDELSPHTFGNEDRLPRIPVPSLEDSGARLLEWCAPLVDDDQYAATRAAVDELLAGPGPALQEALVAYDARPDVHSWLDAFWEARYLGRRDRIALNANFLFLFGPGADDAGRDDQPAADQAERAARLVTGALAHQHQVDTETLPPVTRRGEPTTMEQHRYLFSATRIPGIDQDTTRTPYTDEWPGPSRERHVLVFAGGSMFRLDVIGPDGVPHTTAEIAAGLRTIAAGAGDGPPSIGPLTTKARAAWAASRRELLDADPVNPGALDVVETALLCVALEDVVPADDTAACAQLLHGDSRHRWFDKAVSFVVFADGTAGINVEHCRLDGTTVLALIDGILSTPTADHEAVTSARSQGEPASEPIEFGLTDALRADVDGAAEAFREFAAGVDNTLVTFSDIGSDRIKELGVSPDAFMQMAYQLAHVRAKGYVGPTYESIATLRYHHGRTEAMRVVTPEVLAYVAAMTGDAADDRRAAFEAAAEAHGRRAAQCQRYEAPEQHLWELSLIAQRQGGEPLAVTSSPGWTIMRDDAMSTSSAPSVHVRGFGFGSTSSHCIGVAYVLLPDRLILHLSTPTEVGEQMAVFADELRRAVDEQVALLGE